MACDAYRDVFQSITSDRGRGMLWVLNIFKFLQSTLLGKNYACHVYEGLFFAGDTTSRARALVEQARDIPSHFSTVMSELP